MSRHAGKVSALVAKDWMIGRHFLIIIVPIYLIYAFIFLEFKAVFLLLSMLYALVLALGATVIEERIQGDALVCSFPVKRSDVVYARYLSAALGAGIGTVTTFCVGLVLDAVLFRGRTDFHPVLTLVSFVGFLLFLAVGVALFFPFYFRYGLVKGSLAFLTVSLGLSILFGSMFHLARLMTHSHPSTGFGTFVMDPLMALVHGISSIQKAAGPAVLVQAALLIIAGLVWISVLVSVRMYSRRDF